MGWGNESIDTMSCWNLLWKFSFFIISMVAVFLKVWLETKLFMHLSKKLGAWVVSMLHLLSRRIAADGNCTVLRKSPNDNLYISDHISAHWEYVCQIIRPSKCKILVFTNMVWHSQIIFSCFGEVCSGLKDCLLYFYWEVPACKYILPVC